MKIWNVLGRLALAAALGSALTFPAYAKEKAYRYCVKKKQTGEFLKFSGFYVWFLIVPLTAVTLLFKWKNGFLRWVSTFLYGGTCAFLIHIEWIYLAMNGRFPQ